MAEQNPDPQNKEAKKTPRPTNQKSIYHSFADVYEKLMNNEIPVEKAEQACNALAGMNRTYALEIKRAELEKTPTIRVMELTSVPTTEPNEEIK